MSTYTSPNKTTLSTYEDCPRLLQSFIRHIVTIEGLSARTANTYYVNMRLFFRYIKILRDNLSFEDYDTLTISDITDEDISLVTEDDVLNYLYFLAGRGDNAATRSGKLSAVKSFYKYACRSHPERFKNSPAAKIERPKLPRRQPKYLSLSEARELISTASQSKDKERDSCIVTLFLHCGMRLSELTAINITSVHEDTLTIVGKGNKERTVYLNDSCLSALKTWLDARKCIAGVEDNALFISRLTKKRLTGRAIEKIIEKLLKASGLGGKGYSPHKLRHTAATLMYDGGADVLELKEVLGHEHTGTTEIYTHVNNKRIRNAAENNPLNAKET